MKIGFYSGSFNPIHIGHVALADYILAHTDLDEVWMVISPQNPLKEKGSLIDDKLRLEMTKLAIKRHPGLKVSDVEFSLPKPSYTVQTLHFLNCNYPDDEFALIIGADNLAVFHQWKDYQALLANYRIIVYPRSGFEVERTKEFASVEFVDAPLFNVSSTEIRLQIAQGNSEVSKLLTPEVWNFIQRNNLYKAHTL